MKQKTMVITGGNRGIGLDITEAYVKAGYFVVVCARQEHGLGSRFGDQVRFIATDVRDESAHCRLVDAAIEKTGTLDVYINNAGFSIYLCKRNPILIVVYQYNRLLNQLLFHSNQSDLECLIKLAIRFRLWLFVHPCFCNQNFSYSSVNIVHTDYLFFYFLNKIIYKLINQIRILN